QGGYSCLRPLDSHEPQAPHRGGDCLHRGLRLVGGAAGEVSSWRCLAAHVKGGDEGVGTEPVGRNPAAFLHYRRIATVGQKSLVAVLDLPPYRWSKHDSAAEIPSFVAPPESASPYEGDGAERDHGARDQRAEGNQ